MPTRAIFLIATLLIAAAGPVLAEQEEISVAVMEFSSKGGVEQEKMDALSDMLANEIRSLGPYRVVGKSDIQAALAMEEQKQLLGCSDDSCIAEIGGALGVRWIIVGNISLFGKTYLLNLKLIDVTTIKVQAGLSKKISGGEDMLIDGLGAAARELIDSAKTKLGLAAAGDKPTEPGDKPTDPGGKEDPAAGGSGSGSGALTSFGPGDVEASAGAPSKGKTYNRWGHITFWTGAGLGLIGLGGAVFGAVRADDYDDWTKQTDERLQALDDSRVGAGIMYAGVFAGVALMATGTILWILAPDDDSSADDPPAAEASVGLAPTPNGGAVLGIAGRW